VYLYIVDTARAPLCSPRNSPESPTANPPFAARRDALVVGLSNVTTDFVGRIQPGISFGVRLTPAPGPIDLWKCSVHLAFGNKNLCS